MKEYRKCLDLDIYQLNILFDSDDVKLKEKESSLEDQMRGNEMELLLAKQQKEIHELLTKQGFKNQPTTIVDNMDKDAEI